MLDKDLDKLQQQIDDLNRLIDETIRREDFSELETLQDKRNERLGILLLKMQDGFLETRHFHRLEQWLRADETARRYYVEFIGLSALLHLHFNPGIMERALGAVTNQAK